MRKPEKMNVNKTTTTSLTLKIIIMKLEKLFSKKKYAFVKRTALALLLSCIVTTITAQTTIQIGSSMSNSGVVPIRTDLDYSYTQQIYTATELIDAGATGPTTIHKLRFYLSNSSTENSTDWTIYMGNTTRTEFSSNADWEPIVNLTTNYTGTVNSTASGNWVEITLDVPFDWNGVDNIILAINQNEPGFSASNSSWQVSLKEENRSIYYFSSSINVDPTSPPDAAGIFNKVNNIQFEIPSTPQLTCLHAWEKKTPVSINNMLGDKLTNYEMRLVIDTETPIASGDMLPDGSDLRFTSDECCNELCYYIESGINTDTTVVWVNIPLIDSNAITDIYMFYGNPIAAPASDEACTFTFYEGFEDSITNFQDLCGTTTEASITEGNYHLAWLSEATVGSTMIFPASDTYTAEVKVNNTTGHWPGLYWTKTVTKKGYGIVVSPNSVKVSESGNLGSGWCSGHNWISPLFPYSSSAGIWSLTWVETGNIQGSFPEIGALNSTSSSHTKDEGLILMLGGIASGAGSIDVDWIRVRKYAEIPPVYSIGTPVPFNPGPELNLENSLTACEEITIDAGIGYVTYAWSTGGTSQTENIGASDTVSIVVTDSETCFQIDTIVLTIGEVHNILVEDTLCSGTDYTFPDGTIATNISNTLTQTSHLVTYLGCDSLIFTSLSVFDQPLLLDLGSDLDSCEDSVVIDAGDGFVSYEWNNGSFLQTDTALISGNYSVTVTDNFGCEQTDELYVSITSLDNSVSVSGITLTSNEINASHQWIDCDNDNLPIQGEINQLYTPAENGNYAVIVTNGTCRDTSDCIAINSVGLSDLYATYGVRVYPNPSNGKVYLEFDQINPSIEFRIFDLLGKEVMTFTPWNKKMEINLDVQPGNYFIHYGKGVQKLIIK